jgi:hypothetical protein
MAVILSIVTFIGVVALVAQFKELITNSMDEQEQDFMFYVLSNNE